LWGTSHRLNLCYHCRNICFCPESARRPCARSGDFRGRRSRAAQRWAPLRGFAELGSVGLVLPEARHRGLGSSEAAEHRASSQHVAAPLGALEGAGRSTGTSDRCMASWGSDRRKPNTVQIVLRKRLMKIRNTILLSIKMCLSPTYDHKTDVTSAADFPVCPTVRNEHQQQQAGASYQRRCSSSCSHC